MAVLPVCVVWWETRELQVRRDGAHPDLEVGILGRKSRRPELCKWRMLIGLLNAAAHWLEL